jgi:hypothetical protein
MAVGLCVEIAELDLVIPLYLHDYGASLQNQYYQNDRKTSSEAIGPFKRITKRTTLHFCVSHRASSLLVACIFHEQRLEAPISLMERLGKYLLVNKIGRLCLALAEYPR